MHRNARGEPLEPFPWQERLVRQVAERGRWPDVLALPTASGKTSAIDVAVFTLALQAGRPLAERTAPLRIFFVIDRRVVVDQAAEHARELKQALDNPENDAVRQVAEALKRFGAESPLQVAVMRGGMYRDDSWTRAPNQPTVCVTTVDQVGSRLLFRGYGLKNYRWPIHAGLTGNDVLYLIDEAHLSRPFLETLAGVCRYRAWAERPVGGPFHVAEMSATPDELLGDQRWIFRMEETGPANKELDARLDAEKWVALELPEKFEEQAVDLARKARDTGHAVVGVVVNRVASARRIFDALGGRPDAILLTGRVRPWDRDRLLAPDGHLMPQMKAGRIRSPSDQPLFVVATQSIEVGADLDFDYLITEAASLSALRQRFGRLDRFGRYFKETGCQAGGIILLRKAKDQEDDPIYGPELIQSWRWLKDRAEEASDGKIDFGVRALNRLMEESKRKQPPQPPPESRKRHAPVILPAHVDTWAQTDPVPYPDPDVAPFLHGVDDRAAADVQIVWRADFDPRQESLGAAVLTLASPKTRESLPVPIWEAVAWLRGSAIADIADVEGSTQSGTGADGSIRRLALRWRGPKDWQLIGADDLDQIHPGDTLVVPSSYAGADSFGWKPWTQDPIPVEDIGDLCHNEMVYRAPMGGRPRRYRLRLHPEILELLFSGSLESKRAEAVTLLRRAVKGWVGDVEEGDEFPSDGSGDRDRELDVESFDPGDDQPPLDRLLQLLKEVWTGNETMLAVIEAFLNPRKLKCRGYPDPERPIGLILTAERLERSQAVVATPEPIEADDDQTEEDDTASLISNAVPLETHTEHVVKWAGDFARGCGLDGDTIEILDLVAQLHDLGKADRRFQAYLHGGDFEFARSDFCLLGKSGRDRDDFQREQRLRQVCGVPEGFRHEILSATFVNVKDYRSEWLAGLSEDGRDLAGYLIGVHHGRGRPFIPYLDDRGQEPVFWDGRDRSIPKDGELWRLGSGWTERFWKLIRRHGYWGLAYLEALVVLADHAASRQEEEGRTS
ncbi:MAG TPA: type I-U CRISPR-associated helicase/endonuclease Cas3 [Isosphaeraceae bacterium]